MLVRLGVYVAGTQGVSYDLISSSDPRSNTEMTKRTVCGRHVAPRCSWCICWDTVTQLTVGSFACGPTLMLN
jgi:hypothetical protein